MSEVIITTSKGKLKGIKRSTILNQEYYSFQGIPYAQPPIGKLRFKDPKPIESWEGVRDALKEGGMCASRHMILRDFRGSDDCLYLNVYTPEIKSTLKPVMVWIHGGGFMLGYGDRDLYGPDFFVSHDVILVTLNYRLGVLGFLYIPKCEIGNAGLKDQVAALEWVKENIVHFGGDPNNVTIFGNSAGSSSVHYHMLSPKSKGLFHRAILQSGSAMNYWASSSDSYSKTRALGKILGFSNNDPQELLEFLQSIAPLKLAESQYETVNDEDKMSIKMLFPFIPTIEEEHPNAFITSDPEILMKKGMFHKIPCLTGSASCEGTLILRTIENMKEYMMKIDRNFGTYLPYWMGFMSKNMPQINYNEVKTFFFGDEPITEDPIRNYTKIHSDLIISYKVDLMNRYIVSKNEAPTFIYLFDYEGNRSYFKEFFGGTEVPGASHADDLCYIFHMSLLNLPFVWESSEGKMIRTLTKMWSNFAKNGNPMSPDLKINWFPADKFKYGFLQIGEDIEYKEGRPFQERMNFWDKIYNDIK